MNENGRMDEKLLECMNFLATRMFLSPTQKISNLFFFYLAIFRQLKKALVVSGHYEMEFDINCNSGQRLATCNSSLQDCMKRLNTFNLA